MGQLDTWPGRAIQCSIQRLSALVEKIEAFVTRVNVAVTATAGFTDDAEFGQVLKQDLSPTERIKG